MENPKRIFTLCFMISLLAATALPITSVEAQGESLFKVTIIAPGNANMVRRQWGQIFANSLRLLGIEARVVFLGWNMVNQRVTTPPRNMVGKTWDQGGFDMLMLGHTPGLLPEPRQLFYGGDPAFFAPDGQNYYLWENAQSNNYLDTFITATDPSIANQSLQAWQSLYMDQVPCSFIMYQSAPAIVNPRLSNLGVPPTGGEGWVYFNAQPTPEYIKIDSGSDEVTYCSTGEITDLIPPLSNQWYDTIITAPIHSGLTLVDFSLKNLNAPNLLTSWESTDNGFNWTYNLRHGVLWHDNATFSADDILYTLWALMSTDTASQFVGIYQSVYGNHVKYTWENGTSTWQNSTTGSDRVGHIWAEDAHTVKFTLPVLALGKPYAYFTPYLLSLANNIIPKHIYEKIPVSQWDTSPLNIGQGSIEVDGKTYTGPIGTGPYKWRSFDPVTQTIRLDKFEGYWNRTALEADGLFEVNHYNIKFIADKTAAIAALKNGEVDMLDANYQMQTDIPTINPTWGKVLLQDGTGSQEAGYNMRHPIFGTGVDTPLGKSTPSRAAEAAKYVRIAFDYAIPRQLIIDNLLAGFGSPGATPMLPTQPFYNASVTPRPYDLAMAKEYLAKAGYTVPGPSPPPSIPSFILGMSSSISGTYTDADGNIMANTELALMETSDNTTFDTTSTVVGTYTTDLSGQYFFTVTPPGTGASYYYLFDRQAPAGAEWKFVKMLNVSSLQDAFTPYYNLLTALQNKTDVLQDKVDGLQGSLNTMTYIAVAALVIAVLLGVVAIILPRMRKQ